MNEGRCKFQLELSEKRRQFCSLLSSRIPLESFKESVDPNLRISGLDIVNGFNQLKSKVAKSIPTGARKAT